jgi:hypothetical protein
MNSTTIFDALAALPDDIMADGRDDTGQTSNKPQQGDNP